MPFLQSSTAYRQESTARRYRNGCCRRCGLPARPSAPTDACRLTVCPRCCSSRPAQRRDGTGAGPNETNRHIFPASSPPGWFPQCTARNVPSTDKQYFHAAPAAVYRQIARVMQTEMVLLKRIPHRPATCRQRVVTAALTSKPTLMFALEAGAYTFTMLNS